MTVHQRERFTASEGDAYFRRNPVTEDDLAAKAAEDPLLATLERLDLRAPRVLELGAGNGWRLRCLQQRYPEARCHGLDPSAAATADGAARFAGIQLVRGTCERLPFADRSFDAVLFGFCLYLCDPGDWFRIAAEADRVLAADGFVAIFDFYSEVPTRTPYAHADGIHSIKLDYSRLFSWNPLYQRVIHEIKPYPAAAGARAPDDQVAVTVLRRRPEPAWS